MTQTQPDRTDQLESLMERIERKLDAIVTEIQEVKLESRVFQAHTTEKLEAITQHLDAVETNLGQRIDFTHQRLNSLEKDLKSDATALETRMNAQDARIWGLIFSAVVALMGLLAKLAFFPGGKI